MHVCVARTASLSLLCQRTLSAVIRTAKEEVFSKVANSSNVRARGGLLVGLPQQVAPGRLLQPAEVHNNTRSRSFSCFSTQVLAEYVRAFRHGFWCSLQLYNNYPDNAAFRRETKDVVLKIPCLMICAGRDAILVSLRCSALLPQANRSALSTPRAWSAWLRTCRA